MFARGCLASDSHDAVAATVRPHVEAILALPTEEIASYKPLLWALLGKRERSGTLPLYDLNDVNVLIDEDCQVTRVIDWELSAPKPFGVGFGRIHTIAGECTGGEFWMPEEFEAAERGFWQELFAGLSDQTRAALERDMDLVQDAVILGTLLDAFFWEGGNVGLQRDYSQGSSQVCELPDSVCKRR